MDRHFLEFWGNFLLQVANGQKQLEDLAKWSKQGFNFGDFTTLFRHSYGLEQPKPDSPDYQEIWKKAEADFRNSFQDYLSLLGVVPRDEYRELARKYEALEEKLAEQEETIQHLRQLLSEKGLDYAVATLEFQKLMKKQSEQFQELMKDFGEAFKEGATNEDVP
jgi:DnaJ-domain-containing protein 1